MNADDVATARRRSKVLLVVIAVMFGVISGLVAFDLALFSGAGAPAAISQGFIAFGGAVPLAILVARTLGL